MAADYPHPVISVFSFVKWAGLVMPLQGDTELLATESCGWGFLSACSMCSMILPPPQDQRVLGNTEPMSFQQAAGRSQWDDRVCVSHL